MALGERMKLRRTVLNLTQDEVAVKVGKTQKQIWQYESGRAMPNAEALGKLAQALDTSADWLLGLTDDVAIPIRGVDELTATEREVLEMLRAMRPSERLKAVEVLKVL